MRIAWTSRNFTYENYIDTVSWNILYGDTFTYNMF